MLQLSYKSNIKSSTMLDIYKCRYTTYEYIKLYSYGLGHLRYHSYAQIYFCDHALRSVIPTCHYRFMPQENVQM